MSGPGQFSCYVDRFLEFVKGSFLRELGCSSRIGANARPHPALLAAPILPFPPHTQFPSPPQRRAFRHIHAAITSPQSHNRFQQNIRTLSRHGDYPFPPPPTCTNTPFGSRPRRKFRPAFNERLFIQKRGKGTDFSLNPYSARNQPFTAGRKKSARPVEMTM